MKTKYILYGIITSLVGILIGSISHLNYTFSTLEDPDSLGFVSLTLSIGIEAGMLGIALGVAEKRRLGQPAGTLWMFLLIFAFINFYANTYFAISIYKGERNLTWDQLTGIDNLVIATFVILSSSLPFLVLALTELYSIFRLKLLEEEEGELNNKPKTTNKNNKKNNTKKKVTKQPTVIETEASNEENDELDSVEENEENEQKMDSKASLISKSTPAKSKKVPIRVYPPDDTPNKGNGSKDMDKVKKDMSLLEDDDSSIFPKLLLPENNKNQFSPVVG